MINIGLVRYEGILRLFLLNERLYLICVWLGEDHQVTNTQRHTLKKKIGLSLEILIDQSTLNNKHNWEDMCLQLRNQQTCTSDNCSYIKKRLVLNMVYVDVAS